jgi:uncharacterized protein (TIGR03066 family)
MRPGMMIVTGILCVGLSFASAQEGTVAKLVGTWEIMTKGGLPPGSTLTFSKDGKIVLMFDHEGKPTKAEGSYTAKDNTISTKMSFEEKGVVKESVEVHKIKKLTDTDLHTEDKDGKIDEFKKK